MDNRKSKMRKEYRLDEPNGEFKIITLPDNRKNIIFADGTDVCEEMGIKGISTIYPYIRKIDDQSINIYVCENTGPFMFLVSDKDGGKLFPYPLSNVDMDSPKTILVYSLNHSHVALLDNNLEILSGRWHSTIEESLEDSMIFEDNDKYNIFNLEKNEYLLKDYADYISILDETSFYKVHDRNSISLITSTGKLLLHNAEDIYTFELNYKKDPFGGKSTSLSFIGAKDNDGYNHIFTYNGDTLTPYKITDTGKTIKNCEIEEFDINKNIQLIKYYTDSEKINWIKSDGLLAFEIGIDTVDTDIFNPLFAFVVVRNGKFNIVGASSMEPMFKENEPWIDEFVSIDLSYSNYDYDSNMIAVKKNGKCNIMDSNVPDSFCFEKWADDIMTCDKTMIFVLYGEDKYIFCGGELFSCDVAIEGKNDTIFIHNPKTNKWNAIYPYSEKISELDEYGFDGIYDVDSLFPIVERDGKFAFFDTEAGEVVPNEKVFKTDFKTGKSYFSDSDTKYFWFDDVDPFDEDKNGDEFEDYTFEVYKNGEKYYSNEKGKLTKIQSRQL